MATGRMVGPAKSVTNARKHTTWKAGLCLNFVCQVVTDYRGLGVYAPSATHAWQNAKRRHKTGTPPKGAFVFWSTSRHQWGHVALALGNGKVRHSWGNVGGRANVIETTVPWVNSMGYRYLGWSEDLYGQRNISSPPPPKPSNPNAYPGHPHSRRKNPYHTTHVKKIQRKVGAGVDGKFGPETERKVKAWQKKNKLAADGVVGPLTWSKMF
jgi:peptidoglycan hydrolase-like protein with peptidoglycan-binding domain